MKKAKALSPQIAGALALSMLVATSAFAESRHHSGTKSGGSHSSSGHSSSGHSFAGRLFSGRSSSSHSSSSGRSFVGRLFSGRSSSSRSFERSAPRHESRRDSGRSFGSRGGSSHYGRSTPFRGFNYYNSGRHFFGQGCVERILPYRGGYHIWLGGWGYPFFIPHHFYNPFRFRIGLFIGLNAFYDPLGYYSVYDSAPSYPRDGGVYRDSRDSRDHAGIRGRVESIDLQTGIVAVRDDSSRRVMTALRPPRDRRVDDIRVGDTIELSGEWVRGERYDLDADRMDRLDPAR